jgi:hypothetical protein
MVPNKARTGRWGFFAIFKHFSLGDHHLRQAGAEFFLLPGKVQARPSAGNANRWAASAVSTLLSLEVKQGEASHETKTAFTTNECK